MTGNGCASKPAIDMALAHSEERMKRLQKGSDQYAHGVDDTIATAKELMEEIQSLVAIYQRAEATLVEAEIAFVQAEARGDSACEQYQLAAAQFEKAGQIYERVAMSLVAVATTEATVATLRRVCDASMTTAQYRAKLKSNGVNLEGKDIDHICPKSLGGPDSELNYQVMDSSENRSLGNRLTKTKALHCVRMMAVGAISTLLCKS